MTTFSDTEVNLIADGEAARIAEFSLHTADPGTTGAAEATGSPYARQAPTYSAAGAEGPLGATDQPATPGVAWCDTFYFSTPVGTFTHFGAWTSGGAFIGGNALTETITGPSSTGVAIRVGPVGAA